MDRTYLTVAEVIEMHRQLIDEFGGKHGLRDQGALEAAIFRPQIGYYNDLAEEAAALMESLVNNNGFMDGNKRIAFAATHTFLLVNGQELDIVPRAAHDFMKETVAAGQFRFGTILAWIRSHLELLE
jgi:death on curing protein